MLKPTNQLRWAKTHDNFEPTAFIENRAFNNSRIRYKLQQYWQDDQIDDEGEWRDIEVEDAPND